MATIALEFFLSIAESTQDDGCQNQTLFCYIYWKLPYKTHQTQGGDCRYNFQIDSSNFGEELKWIASTNICTNPWIQGLRKIYSLSINSQRLPLYTAVPALGMWIWCTQMLGLFNGNRCSWQVGSSREEVQNIVGFGNSFGGILVHRLFWSHSEKQIQRTKRFVSSHDWNAIRKIFYMDVILLNPLHQCIQFQDHWTVTVHDLLWARSTNSFRYFFWSNPFIAHRGLFSCCLFISIKRLAKK